NRIIETLQGKLDDMFSDIKLAGGGFLNFTFKSNFILNYLVENLNREPESGNGKMVVEHTSINPNKSAHIGHLRNSCLGDTLVRSLRFLGYEVEVQNYLDDTGIQVSDVVWGLLYYQKKSLEEIKRIGNLASNLWYLYPEVSRLFAEDEAAKKGRDDVHKKIEEKINPEYDVSNYIAEEVLKDHIRVMNILDIRYDLLVRESDIIELDFFTDAQKLMEEKNVLYASRDPEKKGCLVIKYEKENIEKIVIRSNHTITYIGKDIAYTLWKVGLFDRDFYYREFYTYESDGKKIYMTDFNPNEETFNYGGGENAYNVIDVRQSYLQNIISQILGPLSPAGHQRKFTHFSYEMVALTPRCVEEMGFEISEEQKKKSYVEVSGRKGIAVKADDLIDKLIEKSYGEVTSRAPEMEEKAARAIAKDIALGALRYFMIRFGSNSVIAFDFKDALAFEGETGPYLQYTMVRINSILRKLEEAGSAVESGESRLDGSILDRKEYDTSYEILLELSLLELQVELALSNHELSAITSYTYSLCQKFNHYYHLFPIMKEKNEQLKGLRLQLVLLVKDKLEKLLGMMGIPIPEKM
ncbi:MAG: arginine--tRNA ligase, partial [bacterium]|nr:arginine--tRNA ligase [bacterium]